MSKIKVDDIAIFLFLSNPIQSKIFLIIDWIKIDEILLIFYRFLDYYNFFPVSTNADDNLF